MLLVLLLISPALAGCAEMIPDPPVEGNDPIWTTEYHNFTYEDTNNSTMPVKILQDSTGGRSVGIDTFKNSSGTSIPVYWPGGGVLPIVTTTADRSDIYSFKTFDGDNVTSSGLYGVVGGQNFA